MLISSPNDLAVEPVAAHLRLVVTRLARRLRQEGGTGLSPSMAAALATVGRLGPLTPSALADAERVARPTTTRIVAHLEAEGLVRREPDPDDRRVARLHLTAPGEALLAELRGRKEAFLVARLQALAPEEVAVLERASAILERVLEAPG